MRHLRFLSVPSSRSGAAVRPADLLHPSHLPVVEHRWVSGDLWSLGAGQLELLPPRCRRVRLVVRASH